MKTRRINQIKQSTQKGFTLIETIIVLAILGAIIAAVMIRQSSANNQNKANEVVSSLSQTIGEVRSAFSTANDFTKVTTANIIAAGLVHPPLTVSGTEIYDPWNRTITFLGSQNFFAVLLRAPDDSATCLKLVSTLAADALQVGSGKSALTVTTSGLSSKTIKDTLSTTSIVNFQPDLAATACQTPNTYFGFLYR